VAERKRWQRQNQTEEAKADEKRRNRERMAKRSPAQKAADNKRKADASKLLQGIVRLRKFQYHIPLRTPAVVPITQPLHFTILVASPKVQELFFIASSAAGFPAEENTTAGGVATPQDSSAIEHCPPQLTFSGGFLRVAVTTGFPATSHSRIQNAWYQCWPPIQVDGQSCSLCSMLKRQHKALIYSICEKAKVRISE
jgi:hypothetical protein